MVVTFDGALCCMPYLEYLDLFIAVPCIKCTCLQSRARVCACVRVCACGYEGVLVVIVG